MVAELVEQSLRRSPAYEYLRWGLRQFIPNWHYPPPVIQTLVYQPFSMIEKRLYYRGTLSTRNLVLPHFMGIGTMKSGTTWLWGQLSEHPQLNVASGKELHYFCWRFHRSMKYYSRFFEEGAAPGKLNGEITVEYAYLPLERIRFISRLMPDLKLLYIMRNPIDRAWSHAKQELMFRTKRPFDQVRESEWMGRFKGKDSRRLGSYTKTIDTWTSVFGKDRLWVGFYDDIKNRPKELLREVFEFLGVEPDVEWKDFPIEEYYMRGVPAPPLPPRFRAVLEEIYAGEIEELYRRYGDKVAAWRVQ